jgi:hypothetical protein
MKATEMPEQTKIVKDCCNCIWNCLKATEMPEQTEIVKDCCISIWNCLKATEMHEQTDIVKDCCNSIWNCLKATEMPAKAENDWVNIAYDFDRRTQFPRNVLMLWMGNMFDKNANWQWNSVL